MREKTTNMGLHKDMITMCAGCHSVRINNKWIPINVARFLMDISKLQLEKRISHGICQTCAEKIYGPAAKHVFKEPQE
ncbi:MAG: hypothetical protein AB7W47_09135 [Calditrichaceae bacterium]